MAGGSTFVRGVALASPFRPRRRDFMAVQYIPWNVEIPQQVCFCHAQQQRLAHVHLSDDFTDIELITAEQWIIWPVEDISLSRIHILTNEEFQAAYEHVSE